MWKPQAEILEIQEESPIAFVPEEAFEYVPFPSCPLSFLPQHITHPEDVRPQAWLPQAEIAVTLEVSPMTSTGR